MDVKVRVLYAWPNDQLSPDLADLWPNESVGIAMAILDFMSMGLRCLDRGFWSNLGHGT